MNMHFSPLVRRAGVGLLALSLALGLSACGGGGGNPGAVTGTGSGSGGTSTAAPTVTVTFVDGAGNASNTLSFATQLTARAVVKDKSGKPVPSALVLFSTDTTLASFTPANGTALTDAAGQAVITMRAASLAAAGAGTVTATSSVTGTAVTGTANFAVGVTNLVFGPLTATAKNLAAYDSTDLAVSVLAGSDAYTSQPVNVNFSSACAATGKAVLASVVATSIKDGVARTKYRDLGCGGPDLITVTATGIAQATSTQIVVGPPPAASVQFVEATPTDKSIVIAGQGGLNRTETATLKFRVVDTFGNRLVDIPVKFTASPALVKLNATGKEVTDQNGEIMITVNSGTVATTFRVQATLPGTAKNGQPDISTWSDSIVVTTGLPVQRAFSLSAEKYNLDGTVDSSPSVPATRLQVMIADLSGNPVPDGTPVVFQTNMGSVGSSNKGGCNTVNGGCTVDFRVQSPRSPMLGQPATPCNADPATPDYGRRGVATVCASTTDGTNTLSTRIPLFFSGTTAKAYLDGSTTELKYSPTNPVNLGTIAADASRVVTLQLDDDEDNPLPAGTTISVVNMTNGIATVPVPAIVSSIRASMTGTGFADRQGGSHTFSVTSVSGKNCTGPVTATFSVAVATPAPSSVTTLIPFKLAFTCP